MQEIQEYLSRLYKVVNSQVRPLTGAGSNSANLQNTELIQTLMANVPSCLSATGAEISTYIDQWKTAQQAESNVNPLAAARIMNPFDALTDNDHKMFRSFRWFLKQGRQYIVMLGKRPGEYIMLDPTAKIFPYLMTMPNRLKNITETYTSFLTQAFNNNTYVKLLVWDQATTRNADGRLNWPSYSPVDYYTATTEHFLGDVSYKIDEPATIALNPKKPAYFQVPPMVEGDCPILDKWVNLRFKNEYDRNIFRAYICSIFDPTNESRQALWLHDQGQTGKSTILNAITQALGSEVCATLSQNDCKSTFVGSIIYGRRLIVVGDNKNPKLIQTAVVHNVLGGDLMNVEYKGSTAFGARIVARMIIGANCEPDINITATHEKSRVLILKLKGNKELTAEESKSFIEGGGEGTLISNIAKELLPFVHKYNDVYKEMAPSGGNLILEKTESEKMYETIATEETNNFEQIIEDYLIITNNPDDMIPRSIMQNLVKKVYPGGQGSDKFLVSNFNKHLNTAYNIYTKRPRRDKNGKQAAPAWLGVKVNIDRLSTIPNIHSTPIIGTWLIAQEEKEDN